MKNAAKTARVYPYYRSYYEFQLSNGALANQDVFFYSADSKANCTNEELGI